MMISGSDIDKRGDQRPLAMAKPKANRWTPAINICWSGSIELLPEATSYYARI
jgi:hypothetical protein